MKRTFCGHLILTSYLFHRVHVTCTVTFTVISDLFVMSTSVIHNWYTCTVTCFTQHVYENNVRNMIHVKNLLKLSSVHFHTYVGPTLYTMKCT